MLRWWRAWRKREAEDRELAEEVQSHLAIETRRQVEAGKDPQEAAQTAKNLFGNATIIQEEVRETWGWEGLTRVIEDARFGVRMLRKTPVWTAVILATLSLGIGISTSVFSVVYGVLLQPLPYPHPEQIVALWPSATKLTYSRFNVNAALWTHWRERSKSFSAIALTRPIANFNLTGIGAPERLQGARTTFDVPAVLGMAPAMGRTFTKQEQESDAKVAILSHALWQRRFGADPGILGRKIPLNGTPFEVIGIMPPDYRYPSAEFELWTPLYIPREEFRDGFMYQYISVARLKPSVSVDQARAEMAGIMRQLAIDYPNSYRLGNEEVRALVEPLAESNAVPVRSTILALFASAGCLLWIGCMNLSVLLIARASGRAREMAMRMALGASAARVRRQMLAELLPLGLAGAAGGVIVGWCLLKLLVPFLPPNTPRADEIGLHPAVLAFAVGVTLLVVLLAGLVPSLIGSRIRATLSENSRAVSGRGNARNALVALQVAFTLVLLFTGALFARSFQELLRVHPGFSTQGVLTMHLAVTRAKYPNDKQVSDYYDRLLARIRSIPSVTAAGIVNRLPLSGIAQTGGVEFEGKEVLHTCDWRSVTPGYFEAMGISLERGRLPDASDREGTLPVGWIDAQLARKVFGTADSVGSRFRMSLGQSNGPWVRIAGVVGHVLNDSLERDPRPQVYWPETQRTQDRGALVVRTTLAPSSVTPAVLEQIRKEDQDQPVYDIRAMEEWKGRTLQGRTLLTSLIGIFGGASLLLACLGLYGVVDYSSRLRLREFGIRLALGARNAQVRSLVLLHAAKLALSGILLGLLLVWPAGRAMESLLFGVTPLDWLSWIVSPLLLLAVALIAGFGPARKAARTDPAVTLRLE